MDFKKSIKPYKFTKVQKCLLDKYFKANEGVLDEDTKDALSMIAGIPAINVSIK